MSRIAWPILLAAELCGSGHQHPVVAHKCPGSCQGMCRVIVTTDVLEEGLSHRAIALGSLKGLIRTKDTRGFYTSSAPYDEGKSLCLVGIGIAGVSITKRLNSLAWLSICCFLP